MLAEAARKQTGTLAKETFNVRPARQSFYNCTSKVLYAIVIHMDTPSQPTSVLSVRVNADERAILEAAAEQARTSLSDFIRRKALESAELEVMNRTVVTIPAKDWEAFESWLKRPAKANAEVRKLARMKPTWER